MYYICNMVLKVVATYTYLWQAKEAARQLAEQEGVAHFVCDATGNVIAGF